MVNLACSGDVASGRGAPGSSAALVPPQPGASPLVPPHPGASTSSNDAVPSTPGLSPSSASTAAPGTSPNSPSAAPDASDTSLPYQEPTAAEAALEARTWKLTHAQYHASVLSLLDTSVFTGGQAAQRLAPETSNGVFSNLSDAGFVSIANGLAKDYMEIAEEVSAGASDAQLAALGDCATLGPGCPRDSFLTAALSKAFRRPANSEDLTVFGQLFDAAQLEAMTVDDDAFAYRSALKAMLTSPYFLYRTEIGVEPSQLEFELTPYEVASFLSFSVLGQPPSEELLATAANGGLSDLTAIQSQVEALLRKPEAEVQFQHFMQEWLEVEAFLDPDFGLGRDDAKAAAGFDDVKQAMQEETESFLQDNGTLDGTLTALLTAPVSSNDQALTTFYGSEPTSAAAPADRVGIFALGAGLAMRAKDASTSPTLRGLFVRERVMCQHFVVPPTVNPDLTNLEAEYQPETTRELYELHALDAACSGCHALFDPIGFTLETFDEVGRFRSSQNGVPIDTSASLVNSDVDRQLHNHVDLATALAQSEWVRECLARQAFRFYFGSTTSLELGPNGTRLEEDRGLPPIQRGRVALAGAGELRAMVTAVLTTASTVSRTRREPEQL